MIEVTQEMLDNAQELIATGDRKALGYRLWVKPIVAATTLEAAQKAEYSTLAASGFSVKTEKQAEKESKGSQYGIVVSLGDGCFKAAGMGEVTIKEGSTVMFERYAGIEYEIPPGSGVMYRLMNDESLLTEVEAKHVTS